MVSHVKNLLLVCGSWAAGLVWDPRSWFSTQCYLKTVAAGG